MAKKGLTLLKLYAIRKYYDENVSPKSRTLMSFNKSPF